MATTFKSNTNKTIVTTCRPSGPTKKSTRLEQLRARRLTSLTKTTSTASVTTSAISWPRLSSRSGFATPKTWLRKLPQSNTCKSPCTNAVIQPLSAAQAILTTLTKTALATLKENAAIYGERKTIWQSAHGTLTAPATLKLSAAQMLVAAHAVTLLLNAVLAEVTLGKRTKTANVTLQRCAAT